jgi:dihydroorotase/N-acyl-D-amino-acid deacylase
VVIPAWAMAGGQEAFLDRLKDPVLSDSIRQGIMFNLLNDRGGGDLKRIQFAKVDWQPDLEGKTMYEWCTSLEMEPTLENGVELVLRAQQNGGANCIYHVMQEEDVERIMQHPQTMIASDGSLTKLGEGSPHPRSYGTFPRVIGHYARDKKVLTIEEAIHKMTGMPAQRMGLKNRGKITKNMVADLVIFNPETILDKGTFTDPHQYPEGIEYVLVNGVFAVERGEFIGKKAGKVLYGPGKK